ncbi:hypothetical protein HZB04_03200 [Candidatus Wolfebacteria bacterium]|nr:hypothetical protein [Candidatus Wolfebacteria bacterium]
MSKRIYLTVKDLISDQLLKELEQKNDITSQRIKKLLVFSDLTRKENSPLKFILDKILEMGIFKDFDIVEVPEIVSVKNNFDLLNAPVNHPSRKETDTYYVSKDYILRTQTTVMWPFSLQKEEVKKKLEKEGEIGLLCYGKVFRKDEIDRNHFPIFHQIDGLYICKKDKKNIGLSDLQEILAAITKAIYGNSITYRFLEDTFPFTDPSTQIELQIGDKWLEIVGAGVVHTQVLSNLGIDSSIYNGWAFGFGLERIAMAKMNIPDIRIFWSDDPRITGQFEDINSQYKEVSKYPSITRDISFVVSGDFVPNNYFDLIRDIGGDLVEEVKLIDKYENVEKFGENKISYAYRIIYRSNNRTLLSGEIDKIQEKIYTETAKQFNAELR